MNKLHTLLSIAVISLASPAWAATGADCENQTEVKVNGLVCDFCARALEKVFSKREEVKKITVDLENGNITITRHPGKTLDDDTLKQLITDAGYDVTAIEQGCEHG